MSVVLFLSSSVNWMSLSTFLDTEQPIDQSRRWSTDRQTDRAGQERPTVTVWQIQTSQTFSSEKLRKFRSLTFSIKELKRFKSHDLRWLSDNRRFVFLELLFVDRSGISVTWTTWLNENSLFYKQSVCVEPSWFHLRAHNGLCGCGHLA